MAEGDLMGFGRWGPLQRSRKAMKFVLTTMFGAALLVAFLYGAFCLMY
jgi:NADH:ubiquinone oxidoreductase subunit 4 (subunit M)